MNSGLMKFLPSASPQPFPPGFIAPAAIINPVHEACMGGIYIYIASDGSNVQQCMSHSVLADRLPFTLRAASQVSFFVCLPKK